MWFLKFIGVCEVLGALGLVLPGLFRRQQYLTVWAAIGLTIIMIGAVVVSVMTMGIGGGCDTADHWTTLRVRRLRSIKT